MSTSVLEGLTEGDKVRAKLCVRSIKLLETKAGKPYLRLRLGDSGRTLDGVMWNGAAECADLISQDDIAWVEGEYCTYNGAAQISVKSLRPAAPGEYDPADFAPAGPVDLEETWARFRSFTESIESPWLSTLLLEFAADKELSDAFRSAPGAISMHHDYLGGLLEHSVSVARLCELAASQYPEVDRDLLVTGALLHDVGKLEEYRIGTSISITDEGQLIGHIVQGDAIVVRLAGRIPGFPQELLMRLRHIIVSHHGQLEWGSPKTPATREALIIHYMENMDAKMTAIRRAASESADGRWSAFDKASRRSYLVERFEHAGQSARGTAQESIPGTAPEPAPGASPHHSHQDVEDLIAMPTPDPLPADEGAEALDEISEQPSLGL